MSRRDTMRDPNFAPLILELEVELHDADRRAATRGLKLTDSAIRSLLVRAINETKGKVAKSVDQSEKDKFLTEALHKLLALRTTVLGEWERPDGSLETRPLSPGDWITTFEAVKESCESRTDGQPGSRGYLDFLPGFLKQAGRVH